MHTSKYLEIQSDAKLIAYENGKLKMYNLERQNEWIVGRKNPGSTPDISFDSMIVSREHGILTTKAGIWYYIDLGKVNGTYYNGEKIDRGFNGNYMPKMLHNGDVLRIDAENLNTPDCRGVLLLFSTNGQEGNWFSYSLGDKDKTNIGRDTKQNDIVVSRNYVSSRHATIDHINGSYYISDCDSKEGITVNNKKITTTTLLREKDKISICDWNAVLVGDNLICSVATAQESATDVFNAI